MIDITDHKVYYGMVLNAVHDAFEGFVTKVNSGGLIFEFMIYHESGLLDTIVMYERNGARDGYRSKDEISIQYGEQFIAKIFTELICERLSSFDKEVTRFASQSKPAGGVEEGYGHGDPETTGGV